jgi:hypothetical protein
MTPGEFGRPVLNARHLDPRAEHDWRCRVSRASPGIDESASGTHLSEAFLPGGSLYSSDDTRTAHTRNWDYLEGRVLDLLGPDGLDHNRFDVERLGILVEYTAKKRGDVFPSRHPVDVDIHGSYCDGVANLLAALCSIIGAPVRTVQNAVHTMVEVWINGTWSLVDNIPTSEEARNPRNLIRGRGLGALIVEPWETVPGDLPDYQVQAYSAFQPPYEPYVSLGIQRWHFNQAGLGADRAHNPLDSGAGVCVRPSPSNMRAVYQGWNDPGFVVEPAYHRPPYALLLNPAQGWFRSVCTIDRGDAIRRSFYIGPESELEGATAVRARLALVEGVGTEFAPYRGGWSVSINGRELDWSKALITADRNTIEVDIPLGFLSAREINRIELRSSEKYIERPLYRMPDAISFWIAPDFFDIEEPWLETTNDDYPNDMGPVMNTHSAWLINPETQ